MSGLYVIGWRIAVGMVGGAVVGGLGGPALLPAMRATHETAALVILLSALLGGVIEAISERQHRQRARRFGRLLPELEELPDG